MSCYVPSSSHFAQLRKQPLRKVFLRIQVFKVRCQVVQRVCEGLMRIDNSPGLPSMLYKHMEEMKKFNKQPTLRYSVQPGTEIKILQSDKLVSTEEKHVEAISRVEARHCIDGPTSLYVLGCEYRYARPIGERRITQRQINIGVVRDTLPSRTWD